MHCLRSISMLLFAVAVVGARHEFTLAQDASPPTIAPVEADWFSVPIESVRPIEIQTVASTPAPNIADPGPDMGDFPNSSFTLPKGRVYIESAPFTYAGADSKNSAAYNWPYLFRYGVT